ncbi:hypothetical protein N9W11_00465 [Psychrosphaera haliotis]|nr:hypothetical protein [Psychrosphaera haliotis]
MSLNDGVDYHKVDFSLNSNLGVQLHYKLTDDLDVTGQFIYRKQDQNDLDGVTQLAFVKCSVTPKFDIRLGRTAIDVFHFSDVRDIGIAYPWVVLPNEVYGLVPNRYLDGADVIYRSRFNKVAFSSKLFWGKTKSDFSASTFDPIDFSPLTGIKVELSQQEWSVSARYTNTKAQNTSKTLGQFTATLPSFSQLIPNIGVLAQQIDFTNKDINYKSIYGQYNWRQFELSGERVHIDSGALPLDEIDNAFVNLSYINKSHTFFVSYSQVKSDGYKFAETVVAPELVQEVIFGIEEAVNTFRLNQNTTSLGWRWNVTETAALKVQWQSVNIDPRGGGLQKIDGFRILATKETFNNLFASVSFTF